MAENPIDSLRKLNPVALRVYLLDGAEKTVAVPKVRNRWLRVYQVVETLSWTRIEALDKSGAVLGVVEDDELAEELAGGEEEGDGRRDLAMAKVLLEVMRSTQKETRQMFEAQMRGQAELVEALGAGLRSVAQSYEMSMQIERATRVAEAAGGTSNPEAMAMFQMVMGLMSQNRPAIAPAKPTAKPTTTPEGKP